MINIPHENDCDEIHVFYYKDLDAYAIIVLDDLRRGPALGGCRYIKYHSFNSAYQDAVNLAKSMTKKSAIAGINFGGGKAVIFDPSLKNIPYRQDRKKHLMKRFASSVDSLKGKYITAVDSGTNTKDMAVIAEETEYVTGYEGQIACNIDPSFFTATTVYASIKAMYKIMQIDFKDSKILIKGIGNVGGQLLKYLCKHVPLLYISDRDSNKENQAKTLYNAEIVNGNSIYNHSYDLFCPCDIGPTITEDNVHMINARIIVGAANNQLDKDYLHSVLHNKGIVYCPDYVVNSGGLISIAMIYENNKVTKNEILKKVNDVTLTVHTIVEYAENDKISIFNAAENITNRILSQ